MKSSVEQLSPTRVRISVEVPFTELEPDFQRAYKELAKQVGRLTAYSFDHRSLDDKSLAKCNTAAKASLPMVSASVNGR